METIKQPISCNISGKGHHVLKMFLIVHEYLLSFLGPQMADFQATLIIQFIVLLYDSAMQWF